MSRTFDELIRTALLDLARQARPVQLTDQALADAVRQRRTLLAAGAAACLLALGTGTAALFGTPDHHPGTSRPRITSPSPSPSPSVGQADPGCTGTAGCVDPDSSTALTAPTSSPPRSKQPPGQTAPTGTATSDDPPGNRPHPKPSKPHG